MTYDFASKKTVIVLSSQLDSGTAANVASHLMLALGHRMPACDMGQAYLFDASGVPHAGISKYAIILTKTKPARLRQFTQEARQTQGLLVVDYPELMHTTRHDNDLVEALRATPEETLTYYGAAAFGEASALKTLSGRFMLWKGGHPQ